MSESADRQAIDNEADAATVRQAQDAQPGGCTDSNHSNWRRKLAMTTLGAAVAGLTRAIFDWALHEFHL